MRSRLAQKVVAMWEQLEVRHEWLAVNDALPEHVEYRVIEKSNDTASISSTCSFSPVACCSGGSTAPKLKDYEKDAGMGGGGGGADEGGAKQRKAKRLKDYEVEAGVGGTGEKEKNE